MRESSITPWVLPSLRRSHCQRIHEHAELELVCERVKSLLPLVFTGCVLLSVPAPPSTLRQALADDGIKVTPGMLPNLDKPITSGSSLNDSARVCCRLLSGWWDQRAERSHVHR